MSIAWVFPGQGSQKIGMADVVMSLPEAEDRFALASKLLQRDLLEICKGNSQDLGKLGDLNDTRNTQPAMFIIQSLLVDDLKNQGRRPSFVAGHSLGEIAALYAAEVFSFQDALLLLKIRSELMASAGGGAMTAVMGFDQNQLFHVVKATKGVVIANDNSSEQVVLSGSPDAVNQVVDQIECKRSVPLKVSGAFHSPFMLTPAESFSIELDKVEFNNAIFPVVSNAEPSLSIDANLLKERLRKQMISGVRWRETMELMTTESIKTLVEIGPGKVLSGLAKRSLKGISINQISSSIDLGH